MSPEKQTASDGEPNLFNACKYGPLYRGRGKFSSHIGLCTYGGVWRQYPYDQLLLISRTNLARRLGCEGHPAQVACVAQRRDRSRTGCEPMRAQKGV
jgi:hypothetical protein